MEINAYVDGEKAFHIEDVSRIYSHTHLKDRWWKYHMIIAMKLIRENQYSP